MQALYQKQGRTKQFASAGERDTYLNAELAQLRDSAQQTADTRGRVEQQAADLGSEAMDLSQVLCLAAPSKASASILLVHCAWVHAYLHGACTVLSTTVFPLRHSCIHMPGTIYLAAFLTTVDPLLNEREHMVPCRPLATSRQPSGSGRRASRAATRSRRS